MKKGRKSMVRIERTILYKFFLRVKRTWTEYKYNKMGMIGLSLFLFFLFMAASAPFIAPHSPTEIYIGDPLSPPSTSFPLGTDELGRDILSLLIYGSRISLLAGIIAALISVTIGSAIGLLGGYYGGILNEILMRFTDTFLMIPWLALMIVLAAILGANIYNIILIIGITTWPRTTRTVMSQTLSIKETAYVEGVRAVGASDSYIILHPILLNVLPVVFTNAILSIAYAILYEAGLSFLGLGDPTHISWGMMLYYANTCGAVIIGSWWYIIPPGICVILTVLSFTFIGHGLDEIVNPRLRKR